MGKTTTYVGLDVHKHTIVVALAEMGIRGEVREYGKIAHTSAALKTYRFPVPSDGRIASSPPGFWTGSCPVGSFADSLTRDYRS